MATVPRQRQAKRGHWRILAKPGCPYCHRARAVLEERGVKFDYVEVQHDNDRAALKASTRWPTFPMIYDADGAFVGGLQELLARRG